MLSGLAGNLGHGNTRVVMLALVLLCGVGTLEEPTGGGPASTSPQSIQTCGHFPSVLVDRRMGGARDGSLEMTPS